MLKAIERVTAEGFNVVRVLSLVDREEGGRESIKKAGYDLVILKKPELVVSLRRFRSEGRLSVINRWTLGVISLLINKPKIRKNIHYSMGGHVHTRHG